MRRRDGADRARRKVAGAQPESAGERRSEWQGGGAASLAPSLVTRIIIGSARIGRAVVCAGGPASRHDSEALVPFKFKLESCGRGPG